MAATANPDKIAYHSKMAFVVGYTGECGKELVKELLQRQVFDKVVLVGRGGNEKAPLDNELYKNSVQKTIDFDNVEKHKDAFQNCEVGFCCLGTTRSKGGKENFVKVDHDYVVAVGKAARESGVKHFSVISAMGADKDSFFLYPKTKGLMEQHLIEIGFPRLTIFRPALLLCAREEFRLGERIISALMKPIVWTKPTLLSVPTNTLAKAMIADLWRKSANRVEIVDNAAIHELAKEI